jgi:hypothetical protein
MFYTIRKKDPAAEPYSKSVSFSARRHTTFSNIPTLLVGHQASVFCWGFLIKMLFASLMFPMHDTSHPYSVSRPVNIA